MGSAGRPTVGHRVLVLGRDTRSFLAVIRSLGRKGVEVHVSGASADSPSLRSRYVAYNHELPAYHESPDAWIAAMRSLVERQHFDLVIPCDDPSILRLTAYESSGGGNSALELLPRELREFTSSKQRVYETAARLGIPVPVSSLVETRHELATAIGSMRPPYVLKPLASFDASDTVNRREVRKAFSSEDAFSIGLNLLRRSPIQVQENFIGVGTGVEFLAASGEIRCVFQHIRLHEPLHGGGSSYRMGIPVHPRMRAAAEALVRDLYYDGVGMLEFKWNRTTDAFVLIELNARFWGSLPLAVASGADFPWFLFRYRVFGDRNFTGAFRTGIRSRHFTQDVEWLRSNFANDRHDAMLATLPWTSVARELWPIVRGQERIDSLAADDLMPFFVELRAWTVGVAFYIARKLRHLSRQFGWPRRIRTRLLRQRLRSARSIEFVCYGNICRSPFAAAVASDLHAKGQLRPTARSSGLHAREGCASPDLAISVASDFGIDLSRHRSQPLTHERVNEADLILVFDWANFDGVRSRFPQARHKVFLMGELDTFSALIIADPYGRSRGAFEDVYRRVLASLREAC